MFFKVKSKEENEEAIKLALTGKLKILYIAPERQIINGCYR
jgi:superfamily II DNA helicase RecQ